MRPVERIGRSIVKHSTSIVTLAITTGLAVAAGLAFVPLVEARALVVLPLAAVLPSLIVGLGPGRATLPVAAAGCFTFGPALAVLVGTEPAALSDILRDGLLDGFRLALTSALPLEASPAVLLWIFTLVWWASYWAAKSAVTRPALPLVLLPPGLVFLTGVAFGVAAPGSAHPWPRSSSYSPFSCVACAPVRVRAGCRSWRCSP